MEQSRQIIIAGAGISGLTAALAFARDGYAVRLFERAPVLSEVGAGLQLSPNATRILDRIGVLPSLLAPSTRPGNVILRGGRAMREAARMPLGDLATRRWGAPYLVVHRADLHAALAARVRLDPEIELVTGATVSDFATHAMGVTASVDVNGRIDEVHGRMLIAADGVWSRLRNRFAGAAQSRFTGHVAWRATIPAQSALAMDLGSLIGTRDVNAFMDPGIHLVAYPVRSGGSINLVALMKGADFGQKWEAAADPGELIAAMTAASPVLGRMAREAGPWVAWALHEVPPSGPWQDGQCAVMIGDSAHATTPFAAQGAAMGIEDAGALAAALRSHDGDTTKALPAWEAVRKKRVIRVVKRGAFNYFTWHAKGPAAVARDLILKLRRGERLMGDLDWLYGYDAEAPFRGN